MTPLSYHSPNLSLIALETMRLLVKSSQIKSLNVQTQYENSGKTTTYLNTLEKSKGQNFSDNNCNALSDLVLFVQFEKPENTHGGVLIY